MVSGCVPKSKFPVRSMFHLAIFSTILLSSSINFQKIAACIVSILKNLRKIRHTPGLPSRRPQRRICRSFREVEGSHRKSCDPVTDSVPCEKTRLFIGSLRIDHSWRHLEGVRILFHLLGHCFHFLPHHLIVFLNHLGKA